MTSFLSLYFYIVVMCAIFCKNTLLIDYYYYKTTWMCVCVWLPDSNSQINQCVCGVVFNSHTNTEVAVFFLYYFYFWLCLFVVVAFGCTKTDACVRWLFLFLIFPLVGILMVAILMLLLMWWWWCCWMTRSHKEAKRSNKLFEKISHTAHALWNQSTKTDIYITGPTNKTHSTQHTTEVDRNASKRLRS